MDTSYQDFFKRYGGSYRTRHIVREEDGLRGRVKTLRDVLFGIPARRNRRPYYLPPPTGLPPEFIRMDPWELEYLFPIASRARHGILETGRFNGGSIFVMAFANKKVPIHSIDLAPQNDALLKELFKRNEIGSNVKLIVGDSQKKSYPEIGKFDVLYIDGDHTYDGCTNDLNNWYPHLLPGGHILIHDCQFGSEVQPAVIDFIDKHDVRVMVSPYISVNHQHLPTGSLAHLIKRA